MKKNTIAYALNISVLVFSIVCTSVNLFQLGLTENLFFIGTYIPVTVFIWLGLAFDAPLMLIIGIMFCLLLIWSIVWLLVKKNLTVITLIIYILDMHFSVVLLLSNPWQGIIGSLAVDLCIIILYINGKYKKRPN